MFWSKRMMFMQKPKLSDKIKIRKDLDGYLMYQPGRGLTLLNQIGYEIISRCDGNNTTNEISGSISRKYDANIEIVEKDVKEFIEKFELLGIVES